MTNASTSTTTAGRRLATVTGLACWLAVVLPDGRGPHALQWWWHRNPVSVLAGVTAVLALIVLLLASFIERPRGPGLIGSLLALAAAAIWALGAPSSTGAVLLVITSLAIACCIIELATPAPRGTPPTTQIGWSLCAGIGTVTVAALTIMGVGIGPIPMPMAIACGATGLATMLWATTRRAARLQGPTIPIVTIALALVAAMVFILAPVFSGDRTQAVAAARLVMLLATGAASLAALLVAAPAAPSPCAPSRDASRPLPRLSA